MLVERGLEEVPEQRGEAQTLVTKHLGGHCTLREHPIEQPLPVLEQLLMVGFGLLTVGKWLQITQISRDAVCRRTKEVGALSVVALCNLIFWVKTLSFCLHY